MNHDFGFQIQDLRFQIKESASDSSYVHLKFEIINPKFEI